MLDAYSKDAYKAFFILLSTTYAVGLGLVGLRTLGICSFSREMTTLDGFIFSLPLTSIYIVIFLAAAAGYARAKNMVGELPFTKRFNQELKSKSMEKASIKTKIRAGSQITEDNTLAEAIHNLVSSRISILGVVDKDGKVKGVVTSQDILLMIQEVMKNQNMTCRSLGEIRIADFKPRQPMTADADEDLLSVMNKMLGNQYTKLIVSGREGRFCGTVDVMDLVAEIFDEN